MDFTMSSKIRLTKSQQYCNTSKMEIILSGGIELPCLQQLFF